MSSVFDDLIDQETVIATLKDAVAASKDSSNISQEMTHSWLFTGPPGSGRSNAAIAFAAALLCKQGGCAKCINCTSVIDGSHADIDLIRTEGLSIKVDEVRELITRTSWSPSVGNYRVIVIEDADRLTESAANALLKVIEEPGARTVWLLCAPTLTDLIPTIRSRCRHLTLRTPSVSAVAKLLIERDGIDPKMAEFAASAAQGHIGRAKYLATNEKARKIREKIIDISNSLTNIASVYEAAEVFTDLAKNELESENEERDTVEIQNLKEGFGLIGSKLATGGSKAIKDLEKIQKTRNSRLIKDNLNLYLIDLLQSYIQESNQENKESHNVRKQAVILKTIDTLKYNSSPQLALESMFCQLR